MSEAVWLWICPVSSQLQNPELQADRLRRHQMVQIARAAYSSQLWKRSRYLGNRMHDGWTFRRRTSLPRRIRHWPTLPYLKSPWPSPSAHAGTVLLKPFFHWLQVSRHQCAWNPWNQVCGEAAKEGNCSHAKNAWTESLRLNHCSRSTGWSLLWWNERTWDWTTDC